MNKKHNLTSEQQKIIDSFSNDKPILIPYYGNFSNTFKNISMVKSKIITMQTRENNCD